MTSVGRLLAADVHQRAISAAAALQSRPARCGAIASRSRHKAGPSARHTAAMRTTAAEIEALSRPAFVTVNTPATRPALNCMSRLTARGPTSPR